MIYFVKFENIMKNDKVFKDLIFIDKNTKKNYRRFTI